MMESRGNRNLFNANGVNMGTEVIESTVHMGSSPNNMWSSGMTKLSKKGKDWCDQFHLYQMKWTPSKTILTLKYKFSV